MDEIKKVYERYKYMDDTLSDREWMCSPGNKVEIICYDLWQAIKKAVENDLSA
jgi:hypothetical protein